MASLWTPLHAQLHQTLRSRHLTNKGQRILVAVSGGQDSLCLIQLLIDLQPKWKWDLGIAHCNHGWRTDAKANADYVQALAQQWSVPYYPHQYYEDDHHHSHHDDPQNSPTNTPRTTTEAEARHWRYQVLSQTAIAHHYDLLMTGHTASDRAETLLYNLIRGSGTDGLQALSWKRSLPGPNRSMPLVRPLLFMTRTQTASFCQSRTLNPWIDTTNDDWHYARNRIRQDLLPYLQKHFNPKVEQTLAQTAEVLQLDVAYLEQAAEALWNKALISNKKREKKTESASNENLSTSKTPLIVLNRHILASAPLALQRRVMRRCLQQILPKAPNFDHIEKLTTLVTAPNRSQTDPFPGRVIAHVDHHLIIISISL